MNDLKEILDAATMEKLCDAIRNQHPGCAVVDVRFLVNQHAVDDGKLVISDDELAKAVENADRIDLKGDTP